MKAKEAFAQRSWVLLAGQPPRGTNHLPIVEIKDPLRASKGSLRAYKPDLLAWHRAWFIICECKPAYSSTDAAKLRMILESPQRLAELWTELETRQIIDAISPPERCLKFADVSFAGLLAHSEANVAPLSDVGMFVCTEKKSVELVPATSWPEELVILLS